MTKKMAFRIFLLGTLSSAVLFLWLTWDTHRQVNALAHVENLSPQVVAGKRVFEKYNCNDCHTILGFGGYYAPDLTKVVRRVGADGIRLRVNSPEKIFAGSFRKMPHQGVTAEEVEQLVAFLTWVGEIDNGDWPPQDSATRLTRGELRLVAHAGVSAGAAAFQTRGCMHCHSLNGVGGTTGSALDTIGRKLSAAEIKRYVQNPHGVDPASSMPPQTQLTETELDEIAKFLAGLK